jgi:PHD/YefM family antitoxin component YafN of YafNO toxin-antitoxin module
MESALQYVTDDKGAKTAVLLPIREYEALMEDLRDLAAIADRRGEDTIPHDQFVAELREDGILPD